MDLSGPVLVRVCVVGCDVSVLSSYAYILAISILGDKIDTIKCKSK